MKDYWKKFRAIAKLGDVIKVRVVKHENLSVIVDFSQPFFGRILASSFRQDRVLTEKELPTIGQEFDAVIVDFVDSTHQVFLSAIPTDIRSGKYKTWREFTENFKAGSLVKGIVAKHEAFGFFVDFGEAYKGLVEVPFLFDDKRVRIPEDFPQIGSEIEAVIIGFRNSTQQVALSMRASDYTKYAHSFPAD